MRTCNLEDQLYPELNQKGLLPGQGMQLYHSALQYLRVLHKDLGLPAQEYGTGGKGPEDHRDDLRSGALLLQRW